jgi:hypothetical protein
MIQIILHLLSLVIGLGTLILTITIVKFLTAAITLFPVITILASLPIAYVIGVWVISKVIK